MTRSRTIAQKLYLCFAAAILACLVMGASALLNLAQVNTVFGEVVDRDVQKCLLSGAIRNNVSQILSLQRSMNIRTFSKDAAGIDSVHMDLVQEVAGLQKNLNALALVINTPSGVAFEKAFSEVPDHFTKANETMYQMSKAGDSASLLTFQKSENRSYAVNLPPLIDTYQASVTSRLQDSKHVAQSQLDHALWLTAFLILAALGLGVVVIFVVRKINADLRAAASELSVGADQIAAAATQVSTASQSLAQGASMQAASIEETSASSEQINSMAKRNTENAQATANIVAASDVRFAETTVSIADMVAAMEGISTSSEKISRIIKVIDQIAFQTNILALNAAVEAARAGESGMGFAVVAEEVRNLAQRSAQAAQDTASLIEDSIGKSQAGNVKVEQVASVIRLITADSSRIKTLVDQINDGSVEQSRGVDQVTRAIRQMEVTTQGNAASAEQSAAAAEQLTAQSESVKEIVAHLNALVGTTSSSTPRSTPHPGAKLSRPGMGAIGKTRVLASFKAVVAPKSPQRPPLRASQEDLHDTSFQEF